MFFGAFFHCLQILSKTVLKNLFFYGFKPFKHFWFDRWFLPIFLLNCASVFPAFGNSTRVWITVLTDLLPKNKHHGKNEEK
ncbi:MAG: hypothetical protein DWQ02_22310 [Bacteroidetes bacterium]|nr:MAG: hypothetical protein DWQ02_22310 [Bacteroidota bacterium]